MNFGASFSGNGSWMYGPWRAWETVFRGCGWRSRTAGGPTRTFRFWSKVRFALKLRNSEIWTAVFPGIWGLALKKLWFSALSSMVFSYYYSSVASESYSSFSKSLVLLAFLWGFVAAAMEFCWRRDVRWRFMVLCYRSSLKDFKLGDFGIFEFRRKFAENFGIYCIFYWATSGVEMSPLAASCSLMSWSSLIFELELLLLALADLPMPFAGKLSRLFMLVF